MTHDFSMWLEFEEWVSEADDDPTDDFFNMQIRLPDGRRYALNVWTFQYLNRAVKECREDGSHLHGSYLIPPDLFIERMERSLIEAIVADMIVNNELRDEWL